MSEEEKIVALRKVLLDAVQQGALEAGKSFIVRARNPEGVEFMLRLFQSEDGQYKYEVSSPFPNHPGVKEFLELMTEVFTIDFRNGMDLMRERMRSVGGGQG